MNTETYLKDMAVGSVEHCRMLVREGNPIGRYTVAASASLKWIAAPILFRPTKELIQSMAHVEVTLKPCDYQQAYDQVMIDMGDWHALCSIVMLGGRRALFMDTSKKYGTDRLSFTMSLDDKGMSILPDGRLHDSTDITIEEIVTARTQDLPPETAEEDAIGTRALINLNLMLASHPVHRVKTERQRALMRTAKGPDRRAALAAKEKLRLFPQVIDFETAPKLYDVIGMDTGGGVRPHWRKGHWRNQACGVKRLERRPMFIRPMLIHADHVDGPTNPAVEFVA